MYRYDQGKTYALRLTLRKLHPLLLLLAPIVYFIITPSQKIFLYLLLVLELMVLLIEFSRRKRDLSNKKPSITDWISILGTNIYIYGLVILSGGEGSPLIFIILVPTLLFSKEFGFYPGILNLAFLLITLILFNFTQLFSWNNSLRYLTIIILAAFYVWFNEFQNKIFARYNQKVFRTMIRDDLTGLFNRRFLKMKVMKAIRDQKTFSLLMLDINYFKYYNDQWGHTMGDFLLKKVGEILKQAVSPNDTVVRISGDEFLIFLEKSLESNIPQIIKKIQALIEERHFPGEECFPLKKLSLSFGAVSYPEAASTFEEIMEKVDQALYDHKRTTKL